MGTKRIRPCKNDVDDGVVECSTESERQGCHSVLLCTSSHQDSIPDGEFSNYAYDEDEIEYNDDEQDMAEVQWCEGDPKDSLDLKKLTDLWNKYNGITLADGAPASRRLGRFMETALRLRLPKSTLLNMFECMRMLDQNIPTAEEFLKDLKDAGFTYPASATW